MAEFKRGSLVIMTDEKGREVEARVLSYRPSLNLYNVMLTNGDTELVKPSTLALNEKADQSSRQSRMAKSSSPSRSKSRGRGRSRTRSPGRSRKSPVANRRSAPATRVEKAEPEKEAKEIEPAAKANADAVTKPATKEANGGGKTDAESTSRRRSQRLAALDTEKDAKVSAVEKKSAETSSKKASNKHPATWLTILGAVICTVSIPVSVVVTNMMCDKKNCHLRTLSVPKRLATFYDKNAWLAYLGFAALQAVLLLLPIGRRIEGPFTAGGRKFYRLNGWFSLFATLGAFYGLHHYGLPIEMIRTKFFALMAASWAFGTLLSVLVYIKNRIWPTRDVYFRGQTGNMLVDWHAGRETIPRLGSYFDTKMYGARLSLNGLAVMLAGLAYLIYTKTDRQVPSQVYACLGMTMFYILDFYLRENDWLTTFDYLKTGAGYTFFSCAALYPFIFSLPMRFMHDHLEHKLLVELHTPVVGGIVVLFLVGYVLYLISNRIKNAFRRDPNAKRFVDLESIPTSRGKALIVSFPWGTVRHPNYVGDLMMATCVAATTGFGHFMPFVCPLSLAVMFLLRAYDDESRLQQKYGAAWTRYCQRVPFRFVPKVY